MGILKHFELLLLLACVTQHVLVSESREQGRTNDKGRDSRAAGNDRAQSGKAFLKGKFSTKDKTQCTWSANEQDPVTLGVVCSKGGIGFNCEYSARPTTCAPYASNVKAYWKQIARALKKQKNICQDAAALVKAGMCKKAPKDAHFKLMISEPPTPTVVQPEQPEQPEQTQQPEQPEDTRPTSADIKMCTDKTDGKKLAEEYCSGSWVALCNFFFTMVQNEDC